MTTPEETLPEQLPEVLGIKDVVTIASKNMPRIIEGSKKAVAAMKAVTEIPEGDEEKYKEVEELCGRVAKGYDKMNELRTEVTKPLDNFITWCISFEKQLGPDKNSEYTRVRGLLAKFKQQQIEAKKKIEAEAAAKKAKQDHFVDIGASILKNLTDMVMRVAKAADTNSAAYFANCTLEEFDKKAEVYTKNKPTLKAADYDACFNVVIRRDLYTEAEAADIIKTIKEAEPMDKYAAQMIDLAMPAVNEWRAKIPELRENLVKLKNAADETERKKLEDAQRAQADAEAKRREDELNAKADLANSEINAQANLGKMENSFVEQATTQQAGDTGPVKLVLKFTDPKTTPKAFMEIVYHCFAHPKFGGIQKKDKSGKLQVDEQGRPVYIDEVQRFITFFLANCDVEVAGTIVHEDSKITIRK